MSDRDEALTNATVWANRAEAADQQRREHLNWARDAASSTYTTREAPGYRAEAEKSEIDRQRAVEMAQMWTAIANATSRDEVTS